MIILLGILFILFLLLLIWIANRMSFHENYTNNTDNSNDPFIRLFHNKLFIPHKNNKLHYIVSYHNIHEDKYEPEKFNILLDLEPNDISSFRADLVITTKLNKKLLPSSVDDTIYCPHFAWCLNEVKNINPSMLIKNSEEKIPLKPDFCCFMYSNCDTNRFQGVKNRQHFFSLMNQMTNNAVHNKGKCLNPFFAKFHNNGGWQNNCNIYKPYKFVIAFENEQIEGYITEKLILPMIVRCIPIYLGAPDVNKYFNPKSFINVSDFNSFEDCIRYVIQVHNDDALYQKIVDQPFFYNNELDRDLFSIYYGGKIFQEIKKRLPNYLLDYVTPACDVPYNIRFITFADGKKYTYTRIISQATTSNFFKECRGFSLKDLDNDFIKRHSEWIKRNKRGYGYWIWKPYVILQNLLEMKDNDVLIYNDSGCSVVSNKKTNKVMHEYMKLLDQGYLILAKQLKYPENEWSKMDAVISTLKFLDKLDYFDTVFNDNGQIEAGVIIIRKNATSIKLIQAWNDIIQNYHLIDDSPSYLKNHDSFIENRHDQTIFSILMKCFPDHCLGLNLDDDPMITSRIRK
jgi:hypothetical protein